MTTLPKFYTIEEQLEYCQGAITIVEPTYDTTKFIGRNTKNKLLEYKVINDNTIKYYEYIEEPIITNKLITLKNTNTYNWNFPLLKFADPIPIIYGESKLGKGTVNSSIDASTFTFRNCTTQAYEKSSSTSHSVHTSTILTTPSRPDPISDGGEVVVPLPIGVDIPIRFSRELYDQQNEESSRVPPGGENINYGSSTIIRMFSGGEAIVPLPGGIRLGYIPSNSAVPGSHERAVYNAAIQNISRQVTEEIDRRIFADFSKAIGIPSEIKEVSDRLGAIKYIGSIELAKLKPRLLLL